MLYNKSQLLKEMQEAKNNDNFVGLDFFKDRGIKTISIPDKEDGFSDILVKVREGLLKMPVWEATRSKGVFLYDDEQKITLLSKDDLVKIEERLDDLKLCLHIEVRFPDL